MSSAGTFTHTGRGGSNRRTSVDTCSTVSNRQEQTVTSPAGNTEPTAGSVLGLPSSVAAYRIAHGLRTAIELQRAEVELQCCVPPHLFQRALTEAAAARDAAVYTTGSGLQATLDAYAKIRDGYMTGELS